MPRFKHLPLSSANRELRLLTIVIGDAPDEIQCSLSVASLDDNPTYMAISYEWGDSEPAVDIKVDGEWFSVRHNLFLLLQYLASYADSKPLSRPYRFWIDAICINQEDDAEKSSQVQYMGRIYRQAAHALSLSDSVHHRQCLPVVPRTTSQIGSRLKNSSKSSIKTYDTLIFSNYSKSRSYADAAIGLGAGSFRSLCSP